MIAGGELITCDVIEPVCAIDVQQPLSVSNDEGKIGAATKMHGSRVQRGNKVSGNAEIYASNDRVSARRIQVNAAPDPHDETDRYNTIIIKGAISE